MLHILRCHLVYPTDFKLKYDGGKVKINSYRTTILTIIGIQIIMFICLCALLNRVNKLESTHEEDGHEKKEKYVFKKEKK